MFYVILMGHVLFEAAVLASKNGMKIRGWHVTSVSLGCGNADVYDDLLLLSIRVWLEIPCTGISL